MDNNGGFGLITTSRPSRKRRSNFNRRPLNESESPQEYYDSISLSSTPSDLVGDAPSEGHVVHETTNWTNELNFNRCISRASYSNLADAEAEQKSYDEDGVFEESDDFKKSVEDNPAAASGQKIEENKMREVVVGNGNKFNKVKLKVGGITHTIHTKSSSDGSSVAGTSATKSTPSDTIYPTERLSLKENYNLRFTGDKGGLRGVPWKDFSKTGFIFGKGHPFRTDTPEESVKQDLKHGWPSKSKSIIKKHSSDEVYDEEDDGDDDDDDDDEIRYLQKLKTSKIASYDKTEYHDETRGKKLRKISRVMDRNIEEYGLGVGDYESSRSINERKKSRPVRASEDTDYMEDEESVSDGEIEHKNRKPSSEYSKKESSITTRRRATLTGRDISPSLIQFPDGLPPAPPRKPKEQLSEVEQQLKRAEAAQRRRIQNEKAARESEAEAIRKILGQDSSRKRREERIRKRKEELAQERSANAATVASDVVRWVMGPSGTVVTFPDEIGLPSIFEPKPCSYPPPREKCAGPSCTNAYKYRDSKSKLPLCSLQCYKAIHDKAQPQPAC